MYTQCYVIILHLEKSVIALPSELFLREKFFSIQPPLYFFLSLFYKGIDQY